MNEENKQFKTIYNFIPVGVILLIIGCCVGFWFENKIHSKQVVDSIKMQRFLHNNTVYNITPFIEVTNK